MKKSMLFVLSKFVGTCIDATEEIRFEIQASEPSPIDTLEKSEQLEKITEASRLLRKAKTLIDQIRDNIAN